ncbi:MAG TPA: DUF423 domain-containing protein [Prolixibacteraceae bacterium]|nr:DUF423 domain-containing protein [Prolixibacteraceae bacterium]
MKTVLSVAAISGLLAVALGAFGAHGLKAIISSEMLEVYKTGVQYQFYHTFALLAVGILMNFNQSNALKWSATLFMIGIILFSGSLYVLAISGVKGFGIITPFGGITWIAAWILLFVHCRKLTSSK